MRGDAGTNLNTSANADRHVDSDPHAHVRHDIDANRIADLGGHAHAHPDTDASLDGRHANVCADDHTGKHVCADDHTGKLGNAGIDRCRYLCANVHAHDYAGEHRNSPAARAVSNRGRDTRHHGPAEHRHWSGWSGWSNSDVCCHHVADGRRVAGSIHFQDSAARPLINLRIDLPALMMISGRMPMLCSAGLHVRCGHATGPA